MTIKKVKTQYVGDIRVYNFVPTYNFLSSITYQNFSFLELWKSTVEKEHFYQPLWKKKKEKMKKKKTVQKKKITVWKNKKN